MRFSRECGGCRHSRGGLVFDRQLQAICPRSKLAAFDSAAAAGDRVWVPAISLVELTYLTEHQRLPQAALQRLRDSLEDPTSVLRFAPLDLAVADALAKVPRATVPEMPDRIIAATAVSLGLPLITRDAQIRQLPIATIW